MVAVSGADMFLIDFINSLNTSRAMLLLAIALLYLLLGMFLDPIGAMLLTTPFILPIAEAAGFDLLWFGILMTKLLEIRMITPPIGMNVFVLRSAVGSEVSLSQIFRGVMWFLVADAIIVFLIMAYPSIVYLLMD